MKKIALTAAALALATPAFAGNVEVFVAPDEPVVQDTAPGSNAGWVVPLVALVVVGAAIAISQD